MRVAIEFMRGWRCSHSDKRQCAPCWKREMARFLGAKDEAFEVAWRLRYTNSADDEVPDSYTMFHRTGFDAQGV